MAESTQPVHPVQPIHPPPCKKRKVYRRRPQSEDEEEESVHIASPPTTTHSELMSLNEMIRLSSHNADAKADDKVETPFSVAEVLRQRKATQRRRGGIEFRHGGTAVTHDSPGTQATSSPQDEEQKLDKIITVVDRFAPQTGQVADVDQHMYVTLYHVLVCYMMQMLT